MKIRYNKKIIFKLPKKDNRVINKLYKLQQNVILNNPELNSIIYYEQCFGHLLIDSLSKTELSNPKRIFDNLDSNDDFNTYLAVRQIIWILNTCRYYRKRLMIEILKKPKELLGARALIALNSEM